MKKFLFAIALVCFIYPLSAQSIIPKIYCTVLGNTDLKQEYKEQVFKALKDMGVEHPETIAIKKMNRVGSILALMPVSSFTAFGIWFDEKYLDSCSQEKRIFEIYHEAAHYALKHHQKLLGIGSAVCATAIVGLVFLKKCLDARTSHSLTVTLGAAAASVAGIYLGIVPQIVQRQEKAADIHAAKKLISLGKTDVVDAYIRLLSKSNLSDKSALWWAPVKEQASCLKDVVTLFCLI